MPNLIIIAGPNGSGKTTAAPALLRDTLHVVDYVNADVIAQGLSAFRPEDASIQAGRVMLKRIHDLASSEVNFAFETTLASRTFVNLISKLKKSNYQFHLIFLWLQSMDLAISRVRERVKMGGHSIPEETIRRRYSKGLRNLFSLYMPIADSWQLHNNSDINQFSTIASGSNKTSDFRITDEHIWHNLQEAYNEK
jgi:predicted ABC-type ATPase